MLKYLKDSSLALSSVDPFQFVYDTLEGETENDSIKLVANNKPCVQSSHTHSITILEEYHVLMTEDIELFEYMIYPRLSIEKWVNPDFSFQNEIFNTLIGTLYVTSANQWSTLTTKSVNIQLRRRNETAKSAW